MRLGPVVDGKVIVMYGDYPTNTGPIDLLAVAPNGAITTLYAAFDTEETDSVRLLDGEVWAPSIDPRGTNPGSLLTNHGGTYHTVPVTVPGLPVVEHGFDVARSPSGTLLYAGSHTPDTAFVRESADHGTTWTEVLAYATGLSDGDNRFYEFRRKDGRLGVQRSDNSGYYLRQDNGTWSFIAGPATWDPRATPVVSVSGDGTHWNVTTTERGLVAAVPIAATKVTASIAPDGSIWICDGEAIYLTPAPD